MAVYQYYQLRLYSVFPVFNLLSINDDMINAYGMSFLIVNFIKNDINLYIAQDRCLTPYRQDQLARIHKVLS